ncbi:MAG: cell division protein FtsL [Nitrospirota bacterium]|nr:cell division protein FtsL [Nitrospirota bacterium]
MIFTFAGLGRTALFRALVVAVLVVGATFVYLWQHMVMVDLGYRVEKARTELAELQHRHSELQLESASLSELARIERIARDELGMVAPEPLQLVRVVFAAPPAEPSADRPQSMVLARADIR